MRIWWVLVKRRHSEHFRKSSTTAVGECNTDNREVKISVKAIPFDQFGGKKCRACLWEKLDIIKFKPSANTHKFLNRKSEFFRQCPHNSLVKRVLDVSRAKEKENGAAG